jgi:signal peptidase I
MGRVRLAMATYLSSLAVLGAMTWLIFEPGAVQLWVMLAVLAVAIVLWLAEQSVVKRIDRTTPITRLLVDGFVIAATAGWIGAMVVLILTFSRYRSLKMAGNGMSPTLEKGERLIYAKRSDPSLLQRGTVIVYRVSSRSAWGPPGSLVISRILARPGDQLSVRGTKYLVNGDEGPFVAGTGEFKPVVEVPAAPKGLTIPAGFYFVVQESPTGGYDSRVLSLVETSDIVSTRLWHFISLRGILNPVEKARASLRVHYK